MRGDKSRSQSWLCVALESLERGFFLTLLRSYGCDSSLGILSVTFHLKKGWGCHLAVDPWPDCWPSGLEWQCKGPVSRRIQSHGGNAIATRREQPKADSATPSGLSLCPARKHCGNEGRRHRAEQTLQKEHWNCARQLLVSVRDEDSVDFCGRVWEGYEKSSLQLGSWIL